MKIKKVGNFVVDLDNANSRKKNEEYLLSKILYDISVIEKKEVIENYPLIPILDINFIKNYSVQDVDFVFYKKPCKFDYKYSKAKIWNKFVLKVVDNISKEILKKVDVKCPLCGRIYSFNNVGHLYRRNHLLCKNCVYSFAQLNYGHANFQKSIKEKYGYDKISDVPFVKEKIEKTCLEKYGCKHPLQNEEIRKKCSKTCEERYGFANPFMVEEIAKTAKNHCLLYSNISIEFFDKISKETNEKIIYGNEEKTFKMNNAWYRVDGYIQELNIAIEFFGDYYHANPKKYNGDVLFDFWGKKITAKEIWEKDKKRIESMEKEYKVSFFIVWEDDYRNDFNTVKNKIVEFINDKRNKIC
jgi:hypothetical protein